MIGKSVKLQTDEHTITMQLQKVRDQHILKVIEPVRNALICIYTWPFLAESKWTLEKVAAATAPKQV